jgi:predicted outer membrane repeat protein
MEPFRLARRGAPALLAALGLFACSGGEPPTAPQAPAAATTSLPLVNSLADPGDGICTPAQCTLREALGDPTRIEIAFAKGFGGTITLDPTLGPLVIDGRFLSISGPTRGIVVRRRAGDPEFGILKVRNDAHVRLANLTLTGGADSRGGGIEVAGSELSLVNVTVSGNSAGGTGGGMYVDDSQVFLTRSTVIGNSSAVHGGGIYSDGELTLTNSTVRDNSAASSGGGIYNISSDLTLVQSTIQGNEAVGLDDGIEGGGGIYNVGPGTVAIAGTTIAGNRAPEASGGGLLNINTFPQFPIIVTSTISGNSAAVYGGGIYSNNAAVLALNSTLSGNRAVFGGGAWATQDAILSLINSTVAANGAATGGGVGTLGGGELHLLNSLVARNTASNIEPDVSKAASTALFARFTLVGDGTGSGIADAVDGNKVGTGTAPVDPKIGKLGNNGGATRTHALLTGSPAIDAGTDAECQPTDQRGVTRPRGAHCDMGSYER